MSKIPIVNAKTFEKILLSLGFEFVRQKSSHAFYRHSDGRYTTLPFHGTQDNTRPLVRQILREIEVSPEQFISLLNTI